MTDDLRPASTIAREDYKATLEARYALIVWDHDDPKSVRVGDVREQGWDKPYPCSGGAVYTERQSLTGKDAMPWVLLEFISLVNIRGKDYQATFLEFCKIREFVEAWLAFNPFRENLFGVESSLA